MNSVFVNSQTIEARQAKWPPVLVILTVGSLAAFVSETPELFLFGVLVLAIMTSFFYNKTSPPVILFSFFFQWLFFHAQLIDGLINGKSVIFLEPVSFTRPTIIFLGLIAVFVFFLGVFLMTRKIKTPSFAETIEFFRTVNLRKILALYIFVDIGLFIAGKLIWLLPGLVQPLYILTLFRWSIFYILFTTVFVKDQYKGTLLLVILGDMGMGLFSFFSTFKEVIYFSLISYWIFYFRTSPMAKIAFMVIIVATFYLGAIWTAIKDDYREFLNQGKKVQAVLVSKEQAYNKLWDLVSELDGDKIDEGVEVLIDRLSWIGAFDGVYKYVPKKKPHEDGALWLEGITRPFMPRIFFPEKKALEDSKQLNKYSGLRVEEENTSISLSMIAGSYVDFGPWKMHIPLFLFGLFCGWVIRKAFAWGGNPIIGFALIVPTIYCFHIGEESINRVISIMVLYFLVLWFIKKFMLQSFLRYIFS